jgi:hypothetical protein
VSEAVAAQRAGEAGVGFGGCGADSTICSGGGCAVIVGTGGISKAEAGADADGNAGAVGGAAGGDETPLAALDAPSGLCFPSSLFLTRESRPILFQTPATSGISMAVCRIVLGRNNIRHRAAAIVRLNNPCPTVR